MCCVVERRLPTLPRRSLLQEVVLPDSLDKGELVAKLLTVRDIRVFDNTPDYKWVCVLANLIVRDSNLANVDGERIKTVSNWNVEYLQRKLRDYHNKQIIQYLQFGFPIECEVSGGSSEVPTNHAGARYYPDEVNAYISKELQKGTLIGPFHTNPFGKFARFSPLNTRPKKDSPDRRVILDLSFQQSGSVNFGINKDWYRGEPVNLRLPGVDALVRIILKKGRACLIFRWDLKSAYKQVPICLGELHLLGYAHRDCLYFDLTLPMGLVNSCMICQLVSDFIIYIYEQEGYNGSNYLDDLAAAEIQQIAQQAYQILADILQECGAQEAVAKAIAPSTCMLFLGILINTVLLTLQIDSARMAEIQQELVKWANKKTATLKQVQSLVGKLNFCATVVRSGRLFYSRILAFMKMLPQVGTKQIPPEVRQDIAWWQIFTPKFNGISAIPEPKWVGPNSLFSTDACLAGVGGWSQGEFFHAKIPENISANGNVSINELEALAVMIGLKLWGYKANAKKCLIQCDSNVTVLAINSGRSHNPFMQQILREICFLAAINDMVVRAIFVPGNQNRLSDLLSRWELGLKYRKQFWKYTRALNTTEIIAKPDLFTFLHDW